MTPQMANQAMRECRRSALQSQKNMKDTPSRARRLTREMLIYWKRFEKVTFFYQEFKLLLLLYYY